MFKTYLLWFAITGTVLSAIFLPRAHRRYALVWLGLMIEGVGTHLTGWLGTMVLWIGVVLIVGTIYRHRRTLMAGERGQA
jgi:hypothetical protein